MEFSWLRTSAEWQELAEGWDGLFKHSITQVPFLSYGYLSTWWETMGGGEWPAEESELAIIIAREDGALAGIAPLFISSKADSPRALRFIGSIEVSDYLDLIVSEADLDAFCAGLLAYLQSQAELKDLPLILDNILDSSPSLGALTRAAEAAGYTAVEEVLQPSPYIPLAGSFDDWLAGIDKKQRHEIRRKLRNAAANYELNYYNKHDHQNCKEEMLAFLNMMRTEHAKDLFLNPKMEEFMQGAALNACREGRLVLSFLELDGVKAAAYLSFKNGKALLVYNSAFEPEYFSASPGWVLLAMLIEWAIEQGFEEVDMMRGDEVYKYRFGGVNRYVKRLRLDPPA